MKNKPCPFCGADLVQENRLNRLQRNTGIFRSELFMFILKMVASWKRWR